MGERGHPGDLEGMHQEQTHLHPDLWGHGQPGLHAHSWTVSDQNKEAEGQFPTLLRRQKVSTFIQCWGRGGVVRSYCRSKHQVTVLSSQHVSNRRTFHCAVVHIHLRHYFSLYNKLWFSVSRGDKHECKFFDQLVQIFGSKYVTNSDPLAEDTADGVGKNCFTVVHHVSVMQWLYQLDNACGNQWAMTDLLYIYSQSHVLSCK